MLRLLGRKRPCFRRLSSKASFNAEEIAKTPLEDIRNIGVSAHVDSGKTTVTERILYYCGRIDSIHDVKGKDGVGAKMDSMELERQRGITIKSAATTMFWEGKQLNLIDTPGHIDFTMEVERSLRVLDGAILVLCASSGVQTQTFTVNRQMSRYNVPFISFINKMDRAGADAYRTLEQMRKDVGLNAAFLYTPIGKEREFEGIVDVLGARCVYFEGDNGEHVVYRDLPTSAEGEVIQRRNELIECLSNVDEELGERYLMEEAITNGDIEEAIQRTVLTRSFTPVIVGSALKNKGVQPLLDAVNRYLPNPAQVENFAFNTTDESKVLMDPGRSKANHGVGLAFKLEKNKHGQLTYMRMYQGCFRRGNSMTNIRTGDKLRIPRLVLMHSNESEEIVEANAGDIVAMIGVDCASGDTFMDSKALPTEQVTMESMYVPEPVISMTIKNLNKKDDKNFGDALNRFQKEDPTFKVEFNHENKQMVISGMGELQLDIYAERIRREYGCEVELGTPTVNYRETLLEPVKFEVNYKRQSGGRGQFAFGYGLIEPLPDKKGDLEFVNEVTGGEITPNFIKSVRKGVEEAMNEGAISGHRVAGIKFTLQGGKIHAVDSSDYAFQRVGYFAIKEHFSKQATIIEPWVKVEVTANSEFSGELIQSMSSRDGTLSGLEYKDSLCYIEATAPLQKMFGYTSELRTRTAGKGTFTMEYSTHKEVDAGLRSQLIETYRETDKYKNMARSEFGV